MSIRDEHIPGKRLTKILARGDLLTVRELARMKGFEEDATFLGDLPSQYGEVIEAFPPTVAKHIATAINSIIGCFCLRRGGVSS